MRPLAILILSDGRPGHYHLSDGVAASIARRRPVTVTHLAVARRRSAPGRLLAAALGLSLSPSAVLHVGYGLAAGELPPADLVVSAGGETIAANVATARILGAANIFCGTLRHLPPEAFSLVVSSYARHASLPRHLVALKPSSIDPDALRRPSAVSPAVLHERPPRLAGLLVGGNSGLFHYRPDEWQRLLTFIEASAVQHGTRWIASTSRRTPAAVADALALLAARAGGPIERFIDFRTAGPGTLPALFASVEAILATEDSSTMISEAVSARLPVVGVAPEDHAFKDEEREYRAFLSGEGWCRFLPLAELSPDRFLAALKEARPLAENQLDRLAAQLAHRLPGLFSGEG